MSNKSLGMYGESYSEQQLDDFALIREYSLKYNREQEKRKTTGLIVKITFLVAAIFGGYEGFNAITEEGNGYAHPVQRTKGK